MKYFLYARKSTDVEDKQVLSIDAQLSELRALAKQERLNVVEVFVEKKSAKMPGRPVFSEMVARIQKGEAQGIVCWKIDRLARNPVDGGQIQWLLQNSVIAHIQTHDRAYYPADNVLMMSVEFGMANQYIRDLSVNTKRGLREKARQGIYPSSAPLGYLNNPRTKTIVVDRKKAPIIRKAFEMYAENKYRLEDMASFLYQNDLKTHATRRWGNDNGGKAHSKDQMTWMLSNIFYYGHFKYGGEVYEGKHTPLIDKKLFDRVQEVLKLRGKKRTLKNSPQAYCGLLSCDSCDSSITAEKQKGHIYYRCTRKKGVCTEPYVREESLDFQLSELLARFVLPPEWAVELNRLVDKDEKDATQIAAVSGPRDAVKDCRTRRQNCPPHRPFHRTGH
ncbi:MAG: recombinase [Parcubacteria group bacterium Gr01-1014_29]|nr:MAG: recombinase [Parcubacteria group bacterium Gr01-1014_29]